LEWLEIIILFYFFCIKKQAFIICSFIVSLQRHKITCASKETPIKEQDINPNNMQNKTKNVMILLLKLFIDRKEPSLPMQYHYVKKTS